MNDSATTWNKNRFASKGVEIAQSNSPTSTMTSVSIPSTGCTITPPPIISNLDNARVECNEEFRITSSDSIQTSPYKSPRRSPTRTPPVSPQTIRKLAEKTRFWEGTRKNKKNYKNGLPFIVMSYNILAQTYLETLSYLYKECSLDALPWENRLKRLQSEISSIKPDILCLQEVQSSHWEDIASYLDQFGFKGIFKQKTGVRVDGCAIFFQVSKFDLISYHGVEFLQNDVLLLNRDNIGLMAKLIPKSMPDSPFVVCTTHLLYNPRRTDVRLAQMQVFLAEIDRFSYHFNINKQNASHLPIVLTGDLNSLPNTPVTSLVAHGYIDLTSFYTNLDSIAITDSCQHLGVYLERNRNTTFHNTSVSMLYHSEIKESHVPRDRQFLRGYEHLFNNGFVRHNLNFSSVYDHNKKDGKSEASTYQNNWVTVDYIYYSSKNLEVTERYRLPTVDECIEMGFLPNSHFGSDHLSLAAKFMLYESEP